MDRIRKAYDELWDAIKDEYESRVYDRVKELREDVEPDFETQGWYECLYHIKGDIDWHNDVESFTDGIDELLGDDLEDIAIHMIDDWDRDKE